MAQYDRYPEHEIIRYNDDLEGHLRMLSNLGAFVTGVGLIVNQVGEVVTFDRPANGKLAFIPSTLPQGNAFLEDIDDDESLADVLLDSVAERFDLPDYTEMEIIGDVYAFGRDNHRDRHPRVYVPILHHGIEKLETVEPSRNMNTMNTKVRTVEEIYKIISKHDVIDGPRGQRNRAVTRFALDSLTLHNKKMN